MTDWNVLVVDDSNAVRRMMVLALSQLGVTRITEAEDGSAGLELIKTRDYDLVLLDLHMPLMEGTEVVAAARAAGRTMPIVIISTDGESANLAKALKAGATDFVFKSYNPTALRDKIQEIIKYLAVTR